MSVFPPKPHSCSPQDPTRHTHCHFQLTSAPMIKSYDALVDHNANSYFTSSNITKHCRKLKEITKREEGSCSNKRMKENLNMKIEWVKKWNAISNRSNCKHFSHHQLEQIYPYCLNLNQSSRAKLLEFKLNLSLVRRQQKRDDSEFIKNLTARSTQNKNLTILLIKTSKPLEKEKFEKFNIRVRKLK